MIYPRPNKSNQSPIDDVISRLEGVIVSSSGHQWSARCPAHADSRASLRVSVGDDGRVLLCCRTGCDTRSVVAALGLTMADLFPRGGAAATRIDLHVAPQPRPSATPQAKATARTPTDWARDVAVLSDPWRWHEGTRGALSAELRLPALGLDGHGIGVCTSRPHGIASACWTLPEHDGDGQVIGLLARYPARVGGQKLSIPGSQRGLTLPAGWRERSVAAGALYLPEGASDTFTMHVCGQPAVGRASCSDGTKHLPRLLRDLPESVALVVVADLDPHGAGLRGAQDLARVLTESLQRPVRVVLPPAGSKDVRSLFHALAERRGLDPRTVSVEQAAEIGRELVGVLAEAKPAVTALPPVAPVISAATLLPLPAGLPTIDETAEWDRCRALPRGLDCGRCRAKGHAATGRVVGIRLRCRRWTGCQYCRQVNLLQWRIHMRDVLGRLPRAYVWAGPTSELPAKLREIRKAKGHYRCITQDRGRYLVADVPFTGATELAPGEAIKRTWDALWAIPADGVRRACVGSRVWALDRKKDKDAVWDLDFGRTDLDHLVALARAVGAKVRESAPDLHSGWTRLVSVELPERYRTERHMISFGAYLALRQIPKGGDLDIPPPGEWWAAKNSSVSRNGGHEYRRIFSGPIDLSMFDQGWEDHLATG